MRFLVAFLLVLSSSLMVSCTRSSAPKAESTVLANMDTSVEPCVDFYAYACGGWIKKNPLPSDRARYGTFDALQERNLTILKDVLEKALANDSKRSATDQKIGDYYAACMDEGSIDKLGVSPIKGTLDKIEEMKDKGELGMLVADLQNQGFNVFFGYGSDQDLKDSSKVIAVVDQGGMGLPSRDYYFETDGKSQSIRDKYVTHIANMLTLSGATKEAAATSAQAVFNFEKSLAEKALRPVERRDPEKLYHLKPVSELQKIATFMDWKKFMDALGTPPVTDINVGVVEFIQQLNDVVKNANLDDLKAYLRWRVMSGAANLLAKQFEEESFDFYGRTLQGQKEMRPRWWRCTKKVDGLLGEALGQAFVKTAFAGDSKKRTLDLIANLEKALKKDIETELPWMTQETKKQAIVKLAAVAQKIGYPDKWRDYSKLNIVRGDFFGNTNRANAFEIHRQLAKIGQPVDKTEWGMSPPTVNAYYNPQMNDINFPAGILQPPFFHKDWDDALNYGAIGVVIGHEITHGFDDEGRQFDPQGNLRDWWSKDDAKAFNERAQCIVDEYGSFVAVRDAKNGDVKQDGKLTLGENAADNGGIHIAWNALRDYTNVKDAAPIDGLSPSQRFFLSFAQIWCGVQTDDSALTRAKTDPHSAGKFRVNGTVSNMPEFQTAFSCKTGQPMAPEKRCRIW